MNLASPIFISYIKHFEGNEKKATKTKTKRKVFTLGCYHPVIILFYSFKTKSIKIIKTCKTYL